MKSLDGTTCRTVHAKKVHVFGHHLAATHDNSPDITYPSNAFYPAYSLYILQKKYNKKKLGDISLALKKIPWLRFKTQTKETGLDIPLNF